MPDSRQLCAILFTDIVGYTALMQQDEAKAVAVTRHYMSVLSECVASHHGKILNDYGDGSLCSFSSATEAIRCAVDMQQQLQREPKVPLRVGLHIGELFFEGDKVMGDGVNVASRVQSLGVANSILFSAEINDKLKNQSAFQTVRVGRFHFKNVEEPMDVFALDQQGLVVPQKKHLKGKLHEEKSFKKGILPWVILLFLAVAAFFVYRSFAKTGSFTGTEKSIAVLPFDAVSLEKENDIIKDGFAIDLIGKLSNLSGISTVPGWAVVKKYKSPYNIKDIKEIARELDVAAILTGTVQKEANQIRISIELIDVNTEKTIWRVVYNRTMKDLLSLQSEVTESIVTSLSVLITPDEKKNINKRYTDNLEAWKYYTRGRYSWDIRTPAGFDSAEANYNSALKLDPNYALAYAGLADLYLFNQKGLKQTEAIPLAKDYASHALILDSLLVPAMTTFGFIQYSFEYDWDKAKQTLERAISLDPKYAYAHVYYGNILIQSLKDQKEGIEQHRIAKSLDPLSASLNWVLGRTYFFTGEYDSAEQQLKKTMILAPKYYLPKMTMAWLLINQKRFTEAISLIQTLDWKGKGMGVEYQGTILSYVYAAMGDTSKARMELVKTMADNSYNSPYFLARVFTILRDHDKAIYYLEQAYEMRDIMLGAIAIDKALQPLHSDPRFRNLLKKMNLSLD